MEKMAIAFLFTGFVFAVTIVENAADMSCHSSKVEGKPNTYTFKLWGKDIVRDCPGDKVFDAKKCRCDTKKLKANKIVNGDMIGIEEVPWIVVVGVKCPTYTNGQYSHKRWPDHCTGSLLRPRWVLTAKHCEDNMLKSCIIKKNKPHPSDTRKPKMWVEAGVSQFGQNLGVKSEVQKVYKHDVDTTMDIVLLYLETAMPIGTNIRTIPVMTPGSSFWSKTCTSVGFGLQWKETWDADDWVQDSYLYKAETTLMQPANNCPPSYYGVAKRDWMICTKDIDGDTTICNGDSGGPLVCQDDYGVKRVVGVLSRGMSLCHTGYPAVYGYMEKFYDRMMRVMGQEEDSV